LELDLYRKGRRGRKGICNGKSAITQFQEDACCLLNKNRADSLLPDMYRVTAVGRRDCQRCQNCQRIQIDENKPKKNGWVYQFVIVSLSGFVHNEVWKVGSEWRPPLGGNVLIYRATDETKT
jgi:hypothetical protein